MIAVHIIENPQSLRDLYTIDLMYYLPMFSFS